MKNQLEFNSKQEAKGVFINVVVNFFKGRLLVQSGISNYKEMLIGTTNIEILAENVIVTDWMSQINFHVSNLAVNDAVREIAYKYFKEKYPNEFLYNYSTCVMQN